jgi:HEAT repeat protein
MKPRFSSARLYSALFTGILITCVLTIIESLLLLLANPGHILDHISRITALFSLPFHAPQVLVIPLAELVIFSLVVLVAARPRALMAYVREARAAQEPSHRSYFPFPLHLEIRRTAESSLQTGSLSAATIQEQDSSLLDFLRESETHQLVVGATGTGKTMALREYHYLMLQHTWSYVGRGCVALYIPLKNYSLFLHEHLTIADNEEEQANQEITIMLLDFLRVCELPGIRHLRPYIDRLFTQGHLLLLCDGLNEVDSRYLPRVSRELARLVYETTNRLVITCRELDYRERFELVQLVNDGRVARAMVHPLQPSQIAQCTERYIEQQDRHWKHTAGQVLQVIERSRLRYHSTNPMMVFTLLGVIDKVGVERGRQLDTRGRLLQAWVQQTVEQVRQQPQWNKNAPIGEEVIRFLSVLACAAYWGDERYAFQLDISSAAIKERRTSELADALRAWLDKHPAYGPFIGNEQIDIASYDIAQMLLLTLDAELVNISLDGVFSFRHELLEQYFVAEYFIATDSGLSAAKIIQKELLTHVERWSEVVALWAGLLDDPLALAEQFAVLGRNQPSLILQALIFSLLCVGVSWIPPQADMDHEVILPPRVAEAVSLALGNKTACEELAHLFTRCAEEGNQEIYRSLVPLIMLDGIDDLLSLLDKDIVSDLLFAQLQDTVDDVAHEEQVRRITKLLGRFGNAVVDRAAQLSLPAVGTHAHSVRLRAAAINILGGTGTYRAVEPLIARLSDTEPVLVKRAATSLAHLGPELSLTRVLQVLENRAQGSATQNVHQAVLAILEYFLDEHDVRRQVSLAQYQRIIDALVPILTSHYQAEPIVQQQARKILVNQARLGARENALDMRDNRWEKAIAALLNVLSAQNEMGAHNAILALQESGSVATLPLLELLNQGSEQTRLRVIEVSRVTRDVRALPYLLRHLDDPSLAVRQLVARVLYLYAPESIVGLVDVVLAHTSDAVADQAATILADMGPDVVEPITNVLFHIVPGRTRLLVRVLERLHVPESLPALLALLQMAQLDPLLTITIIRALSQFPDERVVPPLLTLLEDTRPQIYEEAINSLSLLSVMAFDGLIAALDRPKETPVTQRVQRALLGMAPFPADRLIDVLANASNAQARHIVDVMAKQGIDAAAAVVKNLLHPDERVRGFLHQMLEAMPGSFVVPSLLELLTQPLVLRQAATHFLLKYPDAAISPLVALLGEDERGSIAAEILPQFGLCSLRPLVSGLDDQRNTARDRARAIMVTLVQQSKDPHVALREMVQLFNPPPPIRAREILLEVLTTELVNKSIPALLEGLEDAHLLADTAEALVRIAQHSSRKQEVIQNLIHSLYLDERRVGAEMALAKIGGAAVPAVGSLLIDEHPPIAKAAKRILRAIGVAALPFIWEAYINTANRPLREAALEVFHAMPTGVIKDELITLLSSEKQVEVSMSVALLLERIRDEGAQQYADRSMVPELLEYVQAHSAEVANQRIIALLLLVGDRLLLKPLLELLEAYPAHREQFTHMLLLLSTEAQKQLLQAFNSQETNPELRAELASILAMRSAPTAVTEYVRQLSSYGLAKTQTTILFPTQLQIALCALGGLLASKQWDVHTLEAMRDATPVGDASRELYNVLLGWRYEPQLQEVQQELQAERDAHKREVLALTARVIEEQRHAHALEDELEQIRNEHGIRGDELFKVKQEKDEVIRQLEQVKQERETLRTHLQQVLRENDSLRELNDQLQWQLDQQEES